MRIRLCWAAALTAAVIASDAAFSQQDVRAYEQPYDLRAADEPLALRKSVVAVVNKQVITRKKLDDLAEPALADLEREGNLPEAVRRKRVNEIMHAALHALINEELLVAEGKRLLNSNEAFKTRFEDAVDGLVEEARRKAGGEVPFREALRKKGLTPAAYREQLRDRRLGDAVYSQFVLRDLSVSPREVLEYYEQNPGEFEEAARVRYRAIFIQVTEERSRDAARKLSDDLQALLKKGADFAQTAREHSDLRAGEGGLSDWTNKGALPKPVDDLLFTLPVGAIGGPVETDAPGAFAPMRGFMIVKVEDRKPARRRPFEEVQGDVERGLLRQKQASRYAALIRRLEAENYVEILP